jgi:hypothetical protein
MELTADLLSDIIHNQILNDENFNEALELVRKNSSGSIWLIGGFLYKNIAHALYGSPKSTKDFDFVIEKAKDNLALPEGWIRISNHFNGIKFVSSGSQIDFIPLADLYYIKANNLKPSIDNFLDGGGLNIHGLVYDLTEERVFGSIGLNALEQRTISAYNLPMLKHAARLYGRTPNQIIRTKADELNFQAVLL